MRTHIVIEKTSASIVDGSAALATEAHRILKKIIEENIIKTASQPGRLLILDADATDAASATIVVVHRGSGHVIVGARCGRAYVSNADDNAVAVVDTRARRFITTVPVGRSPNQVLATPDGSFMYVANQGAEQEPDNTVSVIDIRLNAVVQTLTTDRGAHGVAVSDDGSRVFIANTFQGTVSTIDAATQRLTEAVRVGSGPRGITYRPASR